jgi:argonaute-like protein implicated in RNA metabolism and viral defense
MVWFRSKPEKDLDKIVEKISVASDKFVKCADYLIQVTQYINSNVQALNKQFEEIRKELKETNTHLSEYVKNMDKLQPIGLGEVTGVLDEILSTLKEIEHSQAFDGMAFFTDFSHSLEDIRDEIRNLKYELNR